MGDGGSSIWSRLLRGEQCDEQVEQLLSQFSDENELKLNLGTHRTAVQPFKSPSQDVDAGRLHVLGLDQELALRYSNLKASSRSQPAHVGEAAKAPKDTGDLKADSNLAEDGTKIGGKSGGFLEEEEEEKILGQDLAARFAALKTPSHVSRVSLDEKPPVGDRAFDSQGASLGAQEGKASEAEQVQRLLASLQDSIRLEKARVSSSSASFPFKGVKEGEAAAVDDDVDDDEISESEVDRLVEWAKDAARLELSDSQEEEEEDDNTEDEDGGKIRSIRK